MAEAPWQRGDNDPERLPADMQVLWNEAVDKMASTFNIDLKEKPKRRVMCVERIANLVILMPPEMIRGWLED